LKPAYILLGLFLSFFLVIFVFYFYSGVRVSLEFLITYTEYCEYPVVFSFDFISLGYSRCVVLVSSRVLVFSVFYMDGTLNRRRFLYLLLLFIFSMLVMVFSGSFITILIGWDGLGMTSFCLVIFYDRPRSLSSGILTVLTNRLGDSMFICSLFYFLLGGGFSAENHVSLSFFLVFLLIVGRITKRAQLPFCSWLPAAMAAPTPVSSLVHSSTLVTAGVYVLLRFNYVFSLSGSFLTSLSLITILLAGLSACFETDFKKLIAMSTLSQLGLMVYCMCIGFWKLTVFHMMLHSFFKSMMFISMGGVILSMFGSQEFRYNYSLLNIKFSLFSSIVRSMCLCGFPFVIGFYSKDLIISRSLPACGVLTVSVFLLGCLTTVLYSVRFLISSFCTFFLGPSLSKTANRKIFGLSLSVLVASTTSMGFVIQLISVDSFVLLRGIDLVVGFVLILASVSLLSCFGELKISVAFFSRLVFINWLRRGGVRHQSGYYFFHLLEQG